MRTHSTQAILSDLAAMESASFPRKHNLQCPLWPHDYKTTYQIRSDQTAHLVEFPHRLCHPLIISASVSSNAGLPSKSDCFLSRRAQCPSFVALRTMTGENNNHISTFYKTYLSRKWLTRGRRRSSSFCDVYHVLAFCALVVVQDSLRTLANSLDAVLKFSRNAGCTYPRYCS